MTGLRAERMGLRDRGRIATGLAADLVVFDPATVGDNTTRRAPNRSPSGIDYVVLNGSVVLKQRQVRSRHHALARCCVGADITREWRNCPSVSSRTAGKRTAT